MRRCTQLCLLSLMLLLLTGCTGGQEIESCLFVISMAVDPAPDGNLTVTVKALSGSQESSGESGKPGSESAGTQKEDSQQAEQTEPGYIVLSASAPSCLRALYLLSATTPRTVNLSQVQEIVINRALAQTDATLSILKEIESMYRANGAATVVITPDDAGDFIRRQHALLGVRLSQYLSVLFDHFSELDVIPPNATLSAMIAAMESSASDAAAVYAAGNAFDSALVLSETSEIDRLPGHLPRTSPAQNEYLGAAVFSGARMTGVLTGRETALLCLLMGKAQTRTAVIDGSQYKTNLRTRVSRSISKEDGALEVSIRMNLTRIAGSATRSRDDIAAEIERTAAAVIRRLQAAGSDAIGFGQLAVRAYPDIPSWEAASWALVYPERPVRVRAYVSVL